MVQFKYVLYLNLVNCADYSFISEFLGVVYFFIFYIFVSNILLYILLSLR